MAWSAALALGVPVIDDDHRRLSDLLDDMDAALAAGKLRTAARHLGQFLREMDRHCDREEVLVGDAGVVARRRTEHARARAVLADHPADADDIELLGEAVNYARAWFLDHVVRQDQPLRPLLARRGLAPQPRRSRRLDFLKLRWRIALLAVVPLAALAVVVVLAAAELHRSAAEMALLRDMNALNAEIGGVVHELQRERGLSAMYISDRSQGRTAVEQQTRRTDIAIERLEKALAKVDRRLPDGPARDSVDNIQAALEIIPEVRDDIESGSFDAVTTIDIYTTAIKDLVSLVPEVVRASLASEFTKNTVAHLFLLEAKERAGRERALGASALARGDHPNLAAQIARLSAEQGAFEEGFRSLASPEAADAWRRTVDGPRSNAFLAMRRSIHEDGGRSLTGPQWFAAASQRIDAMREVEVLVSTRQAAEAAALESRTIRRAVALGGGMVALLLASFVMVSVLGWSILPPLRRLGSAMRRLAEGERAQVDIPCVGSRDEFGEIAHTVQQLREHLVSAELLEARRWAENAERLRVVTDNIPGIVFRVLQPAAAAPVVTCVSRKLRELTGLSPEAVTGRPLYRLIRLLSPGGDRMALLRMLDHAAAAGKSLDIEIPVTGAGRERWFRIVASPTRGEEGTAWDGVALDVTGLREAEKDKDKAMSQLNRLYRLQATAQLAGSIGHEINNMLQPILGYSELALANTPAESRVHGYIRNVLKATEEAKVLVDRVLSIGRHSGGERQALDIVSAVSGSVELTRPLLPKHVLLSTRFEGAGARVSGSATEIHQIVTNLCTNAVHAMGLAGGHLTVSTTLLATMTQGRAGTWFRLSVADTGCGMDEQTLAKVFAPFFTTKPEGVGTGLGLAVVRSLVEDSGGWIEVSSEVGRGTTIDIHFPVLEQPANNVVSFSEAAKCRASQV